MTNKQAIEWLIAIKEKYIHGGDEGFDELRKEALDKAVKVAQDYKAYSKYDDATAPWTATSDFVTWASAALAGTHTNLINALTTAGVSETNVTDYANYSFPQFNACLD
jgi:hypothetical protein